MTTALMTTVFRERVRGTGSMETVTSFNRLELLQVADVVAREKAIDRDVVLMAMEDAIQKAARSRYGLENDIHAEIDRSEEHTSELQSLMRISYAVFCLKKKKHIHKNNNLQKNKRQ